MLCRGCRGVVEAGARFCTHCGQAVDGLDRVGRGSTLPLAEWGEVTLFEPIGQGGMGVVHRGWLTYSAAGRLAGTPAHPVAVKVLRPELRSSERARLLFQREASALERLAHPNVVRFIGICEQQAQVAIVMEWVHGPPLSHVLYDAAKARSPRGLVLPLALAFRYFSQLLGALAAVHAIGVLHRDIKPGNVLIRPDGAAKLTDFGIARLPENAGKATGGSVAGTGAYMSPEQVRGDELDPRADLYSASILWYEMLVGTTPFDRPERDEMRLRTAQLEDPPPALGEQLNGIPAELDRVMARALAKDRQHRYGSALELGEAVRRALGLPPEPSWTAQQEFAALAKTLSEPIPRADPELLAQAERLRTAMMTPP